MQTTLRYLRENVNDVFAAVDRNEEVTLTCRGNVRARIVHYIKAATRKTALKHKAFGMWADRHELDDVDAYLRELSKGRFDLGKLAVRI